MQRELRESHLVPHPAVGRTQQTETVVDYHSCRKEEEDMVEHWFFRCPAFYGLRSRAGEVLHDNECKSFLQPKKEKGNGSWSN